MQEVITSYLEMNHSYQLVEKSDSNGLVVVEAEIDEFRLNRFLYQLVGSAWQWTDRLALSDEEWKTYVESSSLKTWVAYFKGAIAGYYELNSNSNGDTEIAYFGLAQAFIGKGFGGYLLTRAIKSAWEMPTTKRVIVHTCTLDHQAALGNYKSRGFTIYKTETSSV